MYLVQKKTITEVELQEILWDYTEWLHKLGYTDSDFYTEEPYAVDRYLAERKRLKIKKSK